MRRSASLLVLGAAALLLQGSLALYVPRAFVPDFAFLVVVTVGLHLPGVQGLLVAAALGYTADLLSGALPGEHALLWAGVWALTGFVNRRLDLRRVPPLLVAVLAFTGVETLGFALLNGGLAGRPTVDVHLLSTAAWQMLVNTLAAPLVWGLTSAVLALVSPDEVGRRRVRLETRRPVI
ncbi:MAG: rod shape-determining protein MreD [Myxococcota bacterium]